NCPSAWSIPMHHRKSRKSSLSWPGTTSESWTTGCLPTPSPSAYGRPSTVTGTVSYRAAMPSTAKASGFLIAAKRTSPVLSTGCPPDDVALFSSVISYTHCLKSRTDSSEIAHSGPASVHGTLFLQDREANSDHERKHRKRKHE